MSRNLIIYKVEYRLRSDPWDYSNVKSLLKLKE